MAKKVTTLFIKDTAVNLLVIERKRRQLRVKKWASSPLEPGLVSQGLVLDEAQVAAKVKELFKLEKAKTKKVIVGLSGLNSLYRLITLPELPEALITEAVKREARRVLPMPLDEVYLSYQPIPAPIGERRIFLVAFPRNETDSLIRTLQRAGIKPYVMDLVPLALCRILHEPRSIIVNTRQDYLDIIVIVDGVPQLIHGITLPTEAKSLPEKLSTISEDLDRAVAFYNSSHPEKHIDSTMPVFVCGDLAEAPESWEPLLGRLNYSVSSLPSPLESPEGFSSNEFMVNIGLALKKLTPEKWGVNLSLVNLNALPEVYQPRAVRVSQILVPFAITAAIGAIAFMAFLVQGSLAHNDVLRSQLAPIESVIDQKRQAILTLQSQIKETEAPIEPIEAEANIFNTTFTSLEEGREEVNADLHRIVNLLSLGDVSLTSVKHAGDAVSVVGIAPDEDDIFEYARELRSSSNFSTVMIASITADITVVEETEIERFRFEFLLK